MGYWAWWMGGGALALVAVGFLLASGRGLGVSGAFSTVIDPDAWRADKRRKSLLMVAQSGVSPLGATASLWLLLGLVAGGALAALQRGAWGTLDMGASFTALFGHGAAAWAVLLGGGFLVGAGTRLAGGCTSGHGLVGVARLQWPSILSTALFFGTAIAVSLVMEKFL